MPWFATNNCAAAANFGWFVGAHSGLFVDVMVVAMFVSARAFRYGATRAVPTQWRVAIQGFCGIRLGSPSLPGSCVATRPTRISAASPPI
jgi:hypothetical protein